jgi:hypothetical protein
MFSDGAYLLDAGWVFFAAWTLILLTIFVIAFGEDLLGEAEQRANPAANKAARSIGSATSRPR